MSNISHLGFILKGGGGAMPDTLHMIGKEVTVTANGVNYSGILIEVSDEEVHLKGPFQWITLPTNSIGAIALKKDEVSFLDRYEGEI